MPWKLLPRMGLFASIRAQLAESDAVLKAIHAYMSELDSLLISADISEEIVYADFENRSTYVDHGTFTVFDEDVNVYAQVPAPGPLHEIFSRLQADYGINSPGRELFSGNAYELLVENASKVIYVGVARRTTRRTVYAAPVYVAPTTTTVVVQDNIYEEQQAAQAQQQAAYAQQQAALAQQQAAEAERRAAEAERQAAESQQQAAQSQQQAILPVGATLPSLPSGCTSTMVNDQSFFSCGGNWFRPAMQNGNIVYAVVADPRK